MIQELEEEKKDLHETGVGFRFLFDANQMRSSAMLFVRWCIDPELIEKLKIFSKTDHKMCISILDPQGRETRRIVSLWSPQEMIGFRCSGVHKISGFILSGDSDYDAKELSESFLKKYCRTDYSRYFSSFKHDEEYGGGSKAVYGNAEFSITVPSEYFAKELSPWWEWYSNLGYGEPSWDGCETKRRVVISIFCKTPLLMIWIPFMSAIRLLYAILVGIVFLRKDVPYEAIIKPFAYDTEDILGYSEKRWEGQKYKSFFLIPFNLAMLMMAMGAIWWSIPKVMEFTKAITANSFFTAIAGIGTIIFGCWLLGIGLSWRGRKKEESVTNMYAELACATPVSTPNGVRSRRIGFVNNVVLKYHEFKFKHCKPRGM